MYFVILDLKQNLQVNFLDTNIEEIILNLSFRSSFID